MKENKAKKGNNTIVKNKKVKVISITLILLLVILGVVSFAYSQNIKIAKSSNEEQIVEEKQPQQAEVREIVLEDNEHMHVELDASGDQVPVPNGFVGSSVAGENEIDSGYVIYALNEGETEDTVEINDTNKDTAQKTRNQYVWVPVPDPSKFYGTDANGKKWGKMYRYTTGTAISDTFDPITGSYGYGWGETNGVMIISDLGYEEPDILKSYDTDSNLHTLELGAETMHEFLMQLEKNFNNMIDSIEKYGGFYIGRYETGNLSQNEVVIRKGNTDITTLNWYDIYVKCKKVEKNNNIETGLIWGNQWDRTIMWLIESGNKTKVEVNNPYGWGNYENSTFEYMNSNGEIVIKENESNMYAATRIPTGSAEYTKANNIYDLARKCK